MRSAEKRLRRMCFALGALVLVVGAGVWLLWPEGERGEDVVATRRSGIREVKPARKETPKVKPKTVDDAMANLGEYTRPEIKPATNAVRKLDNFSPEEWNRLTNCTFKTGVEQLMSWVFTATPGFPPMPIPNLTQEERDTLVAVLISKNTINENDSDDVKAAKEIVDQAKKEMAKFIREGGDPDEFLQYYYEELETAYRYRNEAIDQLEQLAEEDPDLAKEFGKKVNEKLAADGIAKIDVNDHIPEEHQDPPDAGGDQQDQITTETEETK